MISKAPQCLMVIECWIIRAALHDSYLHGQSADYALTNDTCHLFLCGADGVAALVCFKISTRTPHRPQALLFVYICHCATRLLSPLGTCGYLGVVKLQRIFLTLTGLSVCHRHQLLIETPSYYLRPLHAAIYNPLRDIGS